MTKPFLPPTIYHDGVDLYLEWPTLVLRFAFTEGGLTKALQHIPNIAPPARSAPIANKVLPKIAKTTARKREVLNFSADQRNEASNILRRRFGS